MCHDSRDRAKRDGLRGRTFKGSPRGRISREKGDRLAGVDRIAPNDALEEGGLPAFQIVLDELRGLPRPTLNESPRPFTR